MDNIGKIEKIVAWYGGLPKDYTDVESMLYARKQLSTALFSFAGEVGDLYADKISAEFRRKSKIDRLTTEHITGGDSAAAAEKKAKDEAIEEAKQEVVADGLWKKADLLRIHAFAILDTMNQHISSLKQERRLEATAQGSQQ